MVAALTVWILIKALFFMTVILGPIALIGLAIENHLKKTSGGVYTLAVIKLIVINMIAVSVIVTLIWLGVHHKLGWSDWFQGLVVIAFQISLVQEWQKYRKLRQERRQAQALAEAEDNKLSEFHYATEIPK